ncbi:MAG: L-threonylcarbamoyladenylate synthase [Rhizobiaceae bacterium]|nr:L-threonylcarbamoyladenylate synthase [Rhizobiaceae bacterium]
MDCITHVLGIEDGFGAALALLAEGRPVGVPTETVYGLAADATRGEAVAAIYAAKDRPRFNPLIIHVADMAMARAVARFDSAALTLAARFWPGPLTLVLPLADAAPVHPLALAGLDTVAIRMPQGALRDLAAALARPLAAPSANPSGRLSPTTAQAVADGLKGRIPLVLDGGAAGVGVESSIIGRTDQGWALLRPGGLAAGDIEAVLGHRLARAQSGTLIAPGMLASHYAPGTRLRLDATTVAPDEALLTFGDTLVRGQPRAMLNLSPSGDLAEAARNLFSHLRRLDAGGPEMIAVTPIPHEGLGEAINDRLARAAAPRPAPAGL